MSRPDTAATGTSSHYPSSDKSFAYSIISSKFHSTGEVLLLPKVNARKSIKFDKSMSGPKIMAVRETAQWLISSNNRMTDDLSKERQRLDDSYLKWYRKHFNEKKDVLEKVCTLLSTAKKEKTVRDRCRSQSLFGTSSRTPASRPRRHPRTTGHHPRTTFFATELPDVEAVDRNKENVEFEIPEVVINGAEEAAEEAQNGLKSKTPGVTSKTPGVTSKSPASSSKSKNGAGTKIPDQGQKSKTPGAKSGPASKTPGVKSPGVKSSDTGTPVTKSGDKTPDSKKVKVRIVTPEVQ